MPCPFLITLTKKYIVIREINLQLFLDLLLKSVISRKFCLKIVTGKFQFQPFSVY